MTISTANWAIFLLTIADVSLGNWITIAVLIIGLIGSWSTMKTKHDRMGKDLDALWTEFRTHVTWSSSKVTEIEERADGRYMSKETLNALLDGIKTRQEESN